MPIEPLVAAASAPISIAQKFFYELLFFKQPACFSSSYDLQDSTYKLSQAVRRWPFLPLFRKSLAGNVKLQRVSVACSVPFASNPFAPVFYGSFATQDGVTILEGYFAVSLLSRICHGAWLGGCLLVAAVNAGLVVTTPVDGSALLPQILSRLLFVLAPLSLLLLFVIYAITFKWLAREHVHFVTKGIQSALGGVTVP